MSSSSGADMFAATVVTNSGGVAAKKVPKAKAKSGGVPPALGDEPPIEKAQRVMKEILQEGSEAGKYALSLQAHHVADSLCKQLEHHQQFLTKAYKLLQSKVIQRVNSEKDYADALKKVADAREWYISRKDCAAYMTRQMNQKPAAKAKGKAKAKAAPTSS